MTKQEFLEELQAALQGELSQSRINEHLRYYDNYIAGEAAKGRSEHQVTEELGSPRLIAKTLIDTAGRSEGAYGREAYSADTDPQKQPEKGLHADYSEKGLELRYGKFKLNSWYGKLLLLVIVIAIIVVVAKVVAFLLPIVVPVLLVLLVLSLIFGNRR